jgi:MYXO-CTERM domain-containing protein
MLGEDLVFRTAPGIIGGRGIPDTKGKLDQAVMPQQGDWSNFQGRYVILHAWEGALACATPQRGLWGGPSGQTGTAPMTQAPVNRALIGSAPVAGDLTALLAESVPSLSVEAKTPLDPLKPAAAVSGAPATAGKPAAGSGSGSAGQVSAAAGTTATAPNANISKKSGCAVASGDDNGVAWAGLLGVAWLARRRSRRSGAAR